MSCMTAEKMFQVATELEISEQSPYDVIVTLPDGRRIPISGANPEDVKKALERLGSK